MKIWITLCLVWFFARMSLAATAAQGSTVSNQDLNVMKRVLTSKTQALLAQLPLRKLSADGYANVDSAVKSLKVFEQGQKSNSAVSSDLARMIRSYKSFDHFLSGKIEEALFPVDTKNLDLSRSEMNVFVVMARSIIYPEINYYLKLVKAMNGSLSSSSSLISAEEQRKAQSECFAANLLTLDCLYEKSFSQKIPQLLKSIGMSEADDFEYEEIQSAIISLIKKAPSLRSIVTKENFFYEGAQHVLGNYSQDDLFKICLNSSKNFRYWQMESMTYCRAVWQKELGSVNMDPELEAVFFRQVTKFDTPVMRMVQGLSHDILAPKTGCPKKDRSCLERVLKERLSNWDSVARFSESQLESFSKNLAKNYNI